ncbi:MAG TPA: hypothetical protein VLK79_02145 [Gaiellales bacterium]|nr:hypothetical protein [Gaiellales bacterium]
MNELAAKTVSAIMCTHTPAPKPSTVTMSLLDRLLVVVVVAAAAWWELSRSRRPAALEAVSVVSFGLAVALVVVEGLRWQLVPWQLVPWQLVAVAVAAAATLSSSPAKSSPAPNSITNP